MLGQKNWAYNLASKWVNALVDARDKKNIENWKNENEKQIDCPFRDSRRQAIATYRSTSAPLLGTCGSRTLRANWTLLLFTKNIVWKIDDLKKMNHLIEEHGQPVRRRRTIWLKNMSESCGWTRPRIHKSSGWSSSRLLCGCLNLFWVIFDMFKLF